MVRITNEPGFGSLAEQLKQYRNSRENENADNIVSILFDVVLPSLRPRERIDRDYITDLIEECGVSLNRSKSADCLRTDINYWISACKYLGILEPHRLCGEYVVQPDWETKFESALVGFRLPS
jgi:hypothetical protein